jgi:hypothetical protein
MKKLIFLGLSLLVLASLSGCNKGASGASTGTSYYSYAPVSSYHAATKSDLIAYMESHGKYDGSSSTYSVSKSSSNVDSSGYTLRTSFAFDYFSKTGKFGLGGSLGAYNSSASLTEMGLSVFDWGSYKTSFQGYASATFVRSSTVYDAEYAVIPNTFFSDLEIHEYQWKVTSSSFPSSSDHKGMVANGVDAYNSSIVWLSGLLSSNGLPSLC